MTFEQSRLTHNEEVSALVKAGIDPDMNTWDDATWAAADMVLQVAQDAKIERLTIHAKLIKRREELRQKLEGKQ